MAYLDLSSLRESRFEKAQILNKRFGSEKKYNVFLSYRRVDKQYITSVVEFLISIDESIYIDYLDEELYDVPDWKTAPILRQRIEQSRRLIQLITPNSSSSKWMPWELGLGDGVLGYPNAVTLPAINTQAANFDQDYLNMYGHVEKGVSRDGKTRDWVIYYPTGKSIWFKHWLKE